MSPMDARMSFERHATSNYHARDLFAIKTMDSEVKLFYLLL